MVESCVYDVINLKNKSNKEENNYFSNILDAKSFFTQNQLAIYELQKKGKIFLYFY